MQDQTEALRFALKGQYHAALAMLKGAIEKYPDDLWLSQEEVNAPWQVAYHTLYFAHLYLQPNEAAFRPWKHHQSNVQNEDGMGGPHTDSTLPVIPDPYPRLQVLEYCDFCDGMVDATIDEMDVFSPDCGFHWYKLSKLEHQIVNIRHIQIGAAQLAQRLRSKLNVGVGWVGSRHP